MKHTWRPLAVLGAVLSVAAAGAITAPADAARTPTCFGRQATIVSHDRDVVGTRHADVIVVTGAAQVSARGGDDRICGAWIVYAGPGDDRVRFGHRFHGDFVEFQGGRGHDRLSLVSAAPGRLDGGPGNDRIVTKRGWQYALGGRGADTITTGPGNDEIQGGGGNDVLRGQHGSDSLAGDTGSDTMFGGYERDRIDDSAGRDDVARGGPGADPCAATVEHRISCTPG
jgi:Ca2+-binding RTX toxin-like protein